jgi:uncharacterized repeat protein (TIGR01451 family)/LPXTG-motif cell wall-anchored protein
MGKLFTALRRIPKRTGVLIAIVAAAIIVPATLFAWGPDRPTYTIENPADHVTFNSITNNPNIGDERNFVGIREAGTTNLWSDDMTVVRDKEYTVRMYVHNNAAANLNKVAENVTARFTLPTTTGKTVQVDGSITSSNASPTMVYDHAAFKSTEDFNLAYLPGTLKFENNVFGPNGIALPTSIFDQRGATLGYDKLDGKIPGCFQFDGYVSFKVKPQFAPKNNFEMSKQVRKSGETAWQESVATKPGDTVDFLISYKNTGETRQNNVVMKDILPNGLTYVDGTSYLRNGTNPDGAKISDNITKPVGVNVGDYNPAAAAYVKFSAKVNANNDLPVCGPNKLVNKGQVIVDSGYKEDTADVTVPKECQPEVKYTCDALTVDKINRTSFKFTTATTQQNATFKKVTYVIRNAQGTEVDRKESTNKTLDYTRTEVGKYTVEAIVTFTVNGQDKTASSENCKKPFEVEKIPETPVYTCDALTVSKISRTDYSFTGKATAEGGATIVSYTFDFGDGTTATVASPNDMKHKYAKDGTYTAKLSVTVKVNDSEKIVTSDKCAVKVTVSPEECKPGIPMNDERCKEVPCVPTPANNNCGQLPPELPKTGSDDNILALIGAGSLIASVGYYVASRRSLLG